LLSPELTISKREVWTFVSIQSLYFAAISIPFDVLGLIEDNIVTIPSKIGVKRAFLFSKTLMIFSVGMAFFFSQNSFFQWPFLLFGGFTLIFIQLCEKFKNKYLQFYLLDGSIVLQTLIYMLFSK
jgi:4-hydroxybenzoate polyprenyltransferase